MALKIHFLNVGKGSCTMIDPPSGRLTVVDLDDSRTVSEAEKILLSAKGPSLTNPFDYLNNFFPQRGIFRFILTHPDMDHMSGIKQLFLQRTPTNFWDIEHSKELNDWDNSPYDQDDWEFYKKLRSRYYSDVAVLNLPRGLVGDYWTPDNIQVLHPHIDLSPLANEQDEYDHLSHVLKISHAGRSVLLCGDATKEALEHIYLDPAADHSADIVLAPGHGSENHVHDDMLNATAHKLTIVSVAEGVDYDSNFYKKFGPVLSTKSFGNIELQIVDSGDIYFKTQHGQYSDQWYKLIL